jgi:hypothetical protein
MKTLKKISLTLGLLALMLGALAFNNGQAQPPQGVATWNLANYIELTVVGASLDCDFGTISNPNPNYWCKPKGNLQVKANAKWILKTEKTASTGSPDPKPVIRASDSPSCPNGANNGLPSGTIMVDFGTNKGEIEGSGNRVFQVCYALLGGVPGTNNSLGALNPNVPYSVTFTYTATTP